jgi:competence protein ComEA
MRLDFLLRNSLLGLMLAIALAANASAQSQLPEGKGRETVIRVCGGCHDADQAAALRLNRDGWSEMISNMKSLGAEGTDAQFTEVIDYLVEHFAPEPPKKLNINTATSVELESVAGLLRRESAAVLKFVEKTPCKDLTDLKKVEGLDYKKIEERKELLTCAPKPAGE